MIDYKRALLALIRGANRRRKLALDEGEIIGWATNESGEHYPIHAAQGGGGSASTGGIKSSSGSASSGGKGGGEKGTSRPTGVSAEREKSLERSQKELEKRNKETKERFTALQQEWKKNAEEKRAKEDRSFMKSLNKSKKAWGEQAKAASTEQIKKALEQERKWTKPAAIYPNRDKLAKARIDVFEKELKRRGETP